MSKAKMEDEADLTVTAYPMKEVERSERRRQVSP
jgi:hypothetical protein